jgi:hypothetical protein
MRHLHALGQPIARQLPDQDGNGTPERGVRTSGITWY